MAVLHFWKTKKIIKKREKVINSSTKIDANTHIDCVDWLIRWWWWIIVNLIQILIINAGHICFFVCLKSEFFHEFFAHRFSQFTKCQRKFSPLLKIYLFFWQNVTHTQTNRHRENDFFFRQSSKSWLTSNQKQTSSFCDCNEVEEEKLINLITRKMKTLEILKSF